MLATKSFRVAQRFTFEEGSNAGIHRLGPLILKGLSPATAWVEIGSSVSVRIAPLKLEDFEQLPKHARRCIFWEVDPATLSNDDHLWDPEFEKEAWLSRVMLEWGTCGQIATPSAVSPAIGDPACLGYILYAPPRAVPRALRFPTGPVSADAVLLTSIGVDPAPVADGLSRDLIARAVDELMRRGVRALEAFGRTPQVADILTAGSASPDIAPVLEAVGDCAVEHCIIAADYLTDAGFTVVAPHRYFPRLRLELDKGLGWKAEVEAALERLLETARLEQPIGAGAPTGTTAEVRDRPAEPTARPPVHGPAIRRR